MVPDDYAASTDETSIASRRPEDLAPGEAMLVDWTVEEYLADTSALTNSSLKMLGPEGNPRMFYERWILGRRDDNGSKAKTRGTNSHLWLLEPSEWIRRVGVPEIPRPDGANGNASKSTPEGRRARELYEHWKANVERREQLMSAISDRIDVSLDEFRKIQSIVQSVWAHPEALALLSAPGWAEQTVIWREPTTGLLVKGRLDRLVELSDEHTYGTKLEVGLAITDVKTTRDHRPRGFGRSIADYGYLTQAAIYCDALEAAVGRRPNWYWIAAKNESNWGTAVYSPTADQLERGRSEYRDRLTEVLERQFTDDWLAPCERGVQTLYIPDRSRRR